MKVYPRDETIRKIIRHPSTGPFPAEGPAEWPDDSYTARRIQDGDVTTEAPSDDKPSRHRHRQSEE
jgi:hypothetical protein